MGLRKVLCSTGAQSTLADASEQCPWLIYLPTHVLNASISLSIKQTNIYCKIKQQSILSEELGGSLHGTGASGKRPMMDGVSITVSITTVIVVNGQERQQAPSPGSGVRCRGRCVPSTHPRTAQFLRAQWKRWELIAMAIKVNVAGFLLFALIKISFFDLWQIFLPTKYLEIKSFTSKLFTSKTE